MSTTLVTQFIPTPKENYQELADLTIPIRNRYCEIQGYKHFVQSGFYKHPDWYYAFDRLVLLRDLLDKPDATEFYWVLNVQAVITNLTKKVENLLDDEHDLWLTKDVHGINLGSFIVRNTPWTRQWLNFIIGMEPRYRHEPWKEQRAFQDWWMHEDWTHKIHLLPQRSINSFFYVLYPPWNYTTSGNWRPGDLAVNIPGLTLVQRIELVKKIIADKIIIEPND